MSTRNISCGVKTAGAYGWQPYHLHVSTVLKSWSLNLLESSGPVQAFHAIAFIGVCSRSQWLRTLSRASWDCGFESHPQHGCLSLMSVVCCQVEVSASGRPLFQRSTTECGVSWVWSWTSLVGRLWPTRGYCPRGLWVGNTLPCDLSESF